MWTRLFLRGLNLENKSKLRNDQIEQDIQRARRERRLEVSLLLLGPSGSGNSTVAKQMQLRSLGFSPDEREAAKPLIFNSIIQSMRNIVEELTRRDLFPDLDGLHLHAEVVLKESSPHQEGVLSADIQRAIQALWEDDLFQTNFSKLQEQRFGSPLSAYFLNHISRITSPGYTPDDQDLLHLYVPTTGIHETTISTDPYQFRLNEVGHHTSRETKWMHCFSDMRAILFIVPTSEYDYPHLEGVSKSPLNQALGHFMSISKMPWFSNTPIILLFNKMDEFETKLASHPLEDYFPEYKDGNHSVAAFQFIHDLFVDQTTRDKVYPYRTYGLDPAQMRMVLATINANFRDCPDGF